MTVIAEFSLPASAFPLGRAFEEWPDAVLELDRVVPSGDTVMPYFWVDDDDADMEAVRSTFETLPEIRSMRLIEDLGERALFRAAWEPEFLGIMLAIAESNVTVVSARGTGSGWTFELRATEADRFSTFQSLCDDNDVHVTLHRLRQLSEPDPAYGLTDEQRAALVLAYEAGYYRTPRETSLAELADAVDITGQSFGARLRRGTHRLVERTLVAAPRET